LTAKESSVGPDTQPVSTTQGLRRFPQVVVIGAGIVGASVTYHLARRGALVTLIDKGQPAGQCTGKSFAWIGPEARPSPLGSQTLLEYHRLEHELYPAMRIKWSGALVWETDPEFLAKEHAADGDDVYLMERDEIARLEPNLREPPPVAAFVAGAGAVEPMETAQLLVRAAQDSDARVHFDTEAAKLVVSGGRVTGVRVAEHIFEADIVVVAAGVGTNQLTEPIGIKLPIESSPAILVRFRTPGVLVNRIIASPPREVRQLSEDIMVSPEMVSPETDIADELEAVGERVLTDVQRMLSGTENLKLEGVGLGWRPIPGDGLPIVGFVPAVEGLYLTVMHAGVNRAPAIGRLATVEILDGVSVDLLDACRPRRFLERR
jgi:glycine/D-amino acid oxidase-like deaminating enzyme